MSTQIQDGSATFKVNTVTNKENTDSEIQKLENTISEVTTKLNAVGIIKYTSNNKGVCVTIGGIHPITVQFGTFSYEQRTKETLTFPVAFDKIPKIVFGPEYLEEANWYPPYNKMPLVQSISKSQCKITMYAEGRTFPVNWIAISD